MMTHNMDEIPDKWSIGNIDTGYHSCVNCISARSLTKIKVTHLVLT